MLYPNTSNLFFDRHKDKFNKSTEFLDALNRKMGLGIIMSHEFFEKLASHVGIPADQIQTEFDHELIINSHLRNFITDL